LPFYKRREIIKAEQKLQNTKQSNYWVSKENRADHISWKVILNSHPACAFQRPKYLPRYFVAKDTGGPGNRGRF